MYWIVPGDESMITVIAPWLIHTPTRVHGYALSVSSEDAKHCTLEEFGL